MHGGLATDLREGLDGCNLQILHTTNPSPPLPEGKGAFERTIYSCATPLAYRHFSQIKEEYKSSKEISTLSCIRRGTRGMHGGLATDPLEYQFNSSFREGLVGCYT
jgi:hypothetical protein